MKKYIKTKTIIDELITDTYYNELYINTLNDLKDSLDDLLNSTGWDYYVDVDENVYNLYTEYSVIFGITTPDGYNYDGSIKLEYGTDEDIVYMFVGNRAFRSVDRVLDYIEQELRNNNIID